MSGPGAQRSDRRHGGRRRSGAGYWLVASDGGIFSFGDASFYGSTGGAAPERSPSSAWRRRRSGNGYWLVGVRRRRLQLRRRPSFYGSTGSLRLNAARRRHGADAVRVTATGWWRPTVASSATATPPSTARPARIRSTSPWSGMAPTPSGNGYWLVAADGGIFTLRRRRRSGARPAPSALNRADGRDGARRRRRAATGWSAPTAASSVRHCRRSTARPPRTSTPLLVDQLAAPAAPTRSSSSTRPTPASTTATLTAYENDGAGWYQVFGAMPAVDGANGWLPGQSRVRGGRHHAREACTPSARPCTAPTRDPGHAVPVPPAGVRRLVGRGLRQRHLQHVPARGLRDDAALRRRLRGALDRGQRLPVHGGRSTTTRRRAGPLGSGIFLHADTGSPTAGLRLPPAGRPRRRARLAEPGPRTR